MNIDHDNDDLINDDNNNINVDTILKHDDDIFNVPFQPKYQFFIHCIYALQYDLAKETLKQEKDPIEFLDNGGSLFKKYPLRIAVKNNDYKMVQLLIQYPSRNILSSMDSSLDITAQRGSIKIVDILLMSKYYTYSNTILNEVFIPAAHFGHKEVVLLLLNKGANPNYQNNKGTTSLMRASQEGMIDIVKLLLNMGAKPNISNNEGMTALMLAGQRGHLVIVLTLIKAGADINAQTHQGSSALLLTIKRGYYRVAKLLISYGIDIRLKDARQKTAALVATRTKQFLLLFYLEDEGQLHLIGQRESKERTKVLLKMASLYTQKRVTIKYENLKPNESKNYITIIEKTCHLPLSIIRLISSWLPYPKQWKLRLKYLGYDVTDDSSRAVRISLNIFNEILSCFFHDYDIFLKENIINNKHNSKYNDLISNWNTNYIKGKYNKCILCLRHRKVTFNCLCTIRYYLVELRNFKINFYHENAPDYFYYEYWTINCHLWDNLMDMAEIQGSIRVCGDSNITFHSEVAEKMYNVARQLIDWNEDREKKCTSFINNNQINHFKTISDHSALLYCTDNEEDDHDKLDLKRRRNYDDERPKYRIRK